MYVPEITLPGIHIDWPDRHIGWQFTSAIEHLTTSFFESVVALAYFETSSSQLAGRGGKVRWQYERERCNEIRKQIERELHLEYSSSPQLHDMVHFETEVRFKREQWRNGELPSEFVHKSVFMHAKSFIYAIDEFERFLIEMARIPGSPSAVAAAVSSMSSHFPALRYVRNTAQHQDERAQGLGPGRRPLNLQPISTGAIEAGAGALVLSHLNGNLFGCTLGNGQYGEVEISEDSTERVRDVLMAVVGAFPWVGPRQLRPR